jgi:acetylornithine deacetylase/succinyl-diaminopimelate desuccinylase-like protein
VPHARCVVLIEACEESGSYDLPAYVDHLAERIGKPSLVVCLDSGCGNYDQLWCTTSLRGLAGGNLDGRGAGGRRALRRRLRRRAVQLPHLRQLLSRIEDERPAASCRGCTSRSRGTPATGRQGRRGAGHEVWSTTSSRSCPA